MSLSDAEYGLLPSMLSGILPSASSSTKSGSSKPSSRFSVRIFKTPSNVPISYPINAKFDVGYRPGQAEQPWHPTSINAPYDARPRATANYVIYPSAHNDTFIYQQSAASKSDIFSNSEFEISTATFSSPSAFSPALSTDSTTTLKSPSAPDLTVSDTLSSTSAPSSPQTPRLAYPLPAVTPSLQGPVLSKTPSARPYIHEAAESIEERRTRLPALQSHTAIPFRPPSRPNDPMTQTGPRPGGYPIETPEYAASTLSELEVEERDRIAQINAGYNSASTGSFYASSTGSSGDRGTHLVSTTPQNQRTTSSQPLHPTNLPFPIRPQEHDFSHSHSVFPRSSHPNGPAHPALRDSPPSVERLPSQVPSEQLVSQNAPQSQSSFPHTLQRDNWSRDAVVDSDSRSQNAHYPPRCASTASSRSHPGSTRAVQEVAGNAPFSNRFPSSSDHPPQHSIADRRSPIAGGRVDVKDYGVPNAGSDYRTNDTADPTRGLAEPTRVGTRGDYIYAKPDPESRRSTSPPQGPLPHATSQEAAPARPPSASDLRKDARTPTPRDTDERRPPHPMRRDSFTGDVFRPPGDGRSKSQLTPVHQLFTTGPLSSSPTQIRLSPTDYDATTPTRSRDSYGTTESFERSTGRIRTRSISFSNATRPILTLSSSNIPQVAGHHGLPILSHLAPPRGSVVKSSDLTSGRSSSDRPSPKITPSNHTARTAHSKESDRRSSAHYTITQVPSASQQALRQTSTAQTFNPPSKAPSVPLGSYPRIMFHDPSRPHQYYIVPPQPQIHLEPHRRHSDGDRPCNTTSLRGTIAPHDWPSPSSSSFTSQSSRPTTPSSIPEHQRRYSDSDKNPPLAVRPVLPRLDTAPVPRSVRWNDNLICPSPVFPSRRKGWFNRRGDQLWKNDGGYIPAPKHEQYPPDLDEYPEMGEGWMNEEGTRIDMGHHLIPKVPIRSALKQTKLN